MRPFHMYQKQNVKYGPTVNRHLIFTVVKFETILKMFVELWQLIEVHGFSDTTEN